MFPRVLFHIWAGLARREDKSSKWCPPEFSDEDELFFFFAALAAVIMLEGEEKARKRGNGLDFDELSNIILVEIGHF